MIDSNTIPLSGRISTKSIVEENSMICYVGNKRELNINYNINIFSDINLCDNNLISILNIKILEDGVTIYNSNKEISLNSSVYIPVEININLSNNQTEEHLFTLQLSDSTGNITYTELKHSISIEPENSGKQSLILSYKQLGTVFHISFYAAKPVDKVYCKINNNNWKEITSGFDINNSELEGKINYIQIYAKENEKFIYSNSIVINKL
jgi:hypothetical protein